MELLTQPQTYIAFFTLLVLEIVLGVDNIIFISILSGKLPEKQRKKAWQLGLGLAVLMRIGLVLAIGWIMSLSNEFYTWPWLTPEQIETAHAYAKEHGKHAVTGLSGKGLILILGGLFLMYKAVKEIHEKLEGTHHEKKIGAVTFQSVIIQILMLDLVFSIDSVITAVGMVSHVSIMVAAIIGGVAVMLVLAQRIADFVHKHPTVKMLALAFLVLIGVTLLAEGTGQHIEKGYVYFAMAFSVAVEMLNLRLGSKKKAVKLYEKFEEEMETKS